MATLARLSATPPRLTAFSAPPKVASGRARLVVHASRPAALHSGRSTGVRLHGHPAPISSPLDGHWCLLAVLDGPQHPRNSDSPASPCGAPGARNEIGPARLIREGATVRGQLHPGIASGCSLNNAQLAETRSRCWVVAHYPGQTIKRPRWRPHPKSNHRGPFSRQGFRGRRIVRRGLSNCQGALGPGNKKAPVEDPPKPTTEALRTRVWTHWSGAVPNNSPLVFPGYGPVTVTAGVAIPIRSPLSHRWRQRSFKARYRS